MSAEAPNAIAANAEAAPDANAAAEARAELRTLHFNRRIHRQRLVRYQRFNRVLTEVLPKVSRESSDEARTTTVKKTY
jgi:hypothetical protein